jgi:peroxiredoxin
MTAARTSHRFRLAALMIVAAAAVVTAAEAPLGQIGPFELADVDGRGATLDDWKNQKAALIFFLGAECPVSNGYAPSMQRLAEKYAPRGVVSWGVHCDSTLSAEAAAEHAKEYALKFRVLLDPAQTLAGSAGVRVTPEAVVVSPAGKVLYRGRIDDRYSSDGKRRDVPRVYDLEAALEAVLNGEVPKVSQTVSFGCPLPKLKAGPPVN